MSSITIVIADDHLVVREGVKALLAAESDLSVVGEAEDGLSTAEPVGRLQPDVLVLDMIMPGVVGLELVQQVCQCSPHTYVLAFSMCDNADYVRITLQSGAAAYVLKNSPAAELVKAIHEVAAGRRYLSSPLSDHAIALYAHTAPRPGGVALYKNKQAIDLPETELALQNIGEVLTLREREVLCFMVKGWTNASIATELSISQRTVAHHIENLLLKMHVHNRTEAVAIAIHCRWLEL